MINGFLSIALVEPIPVKMASILYPKKNQVNVE
jgi:hypothetical protein